MSPPSIFAMLFALGAAGGAVNAVAGGGSFLVFPTMMFTGVPAVAANATTAAALWPASVASSIAYRGALAGERGALIALSVASAVGGAGGAWLLLSTSDDAFKRILPFLMLLAAVVFTFGGRLFHARRRRMPLVAGALLQCVISLYGGYFGGGMGIMMLATFTVMGMTHMHAMNGLKTVLSTIINGVATVAFFVAGKIYVATAAPVALGALVGGWGGAALAQKVSPRRIRTGVLVFAWTMTAYFFAKLFT